MSNPNKSTVCRFCKNVTSAKREAEALRRHDKYYRTLGDQASDPFEERK